MGRKIMKTNKNQDPPPFLSVTFLGLLVLENLKISLTTEAHGRLSPSSNQHTPSECWKLSSELKLFYPDVWIFLF